MEEHDNEEFDDDEFSAVISNERDIHLCIKFNRTRAVSVAAREALDDAWEDKTLSFGPESFDVIALGVISGVLKELRARY